MSPRDTRLGLILKAVVTKSLKGFDDRLRRALLADEGDDPDEAMTEGERKDVHVRDADGNRVKVGTIRVDQAPTNARVTDEAAFLAWVKVHAPTEVVETVRPSYAARVLDLVKRHGQMPHPATGELVDVPGVSLEVGEPRVVVTPAKGAAQALAEAHQRGGLPQWEGLMREIGPTE